MPLTKWMKDMQDGDQPVELPKYVRRGDPNRRMLSGIEQIDMGQMAKRSQRWMEKTIEEARPILARRREAAEKGRLRPIPVACTGLCGRSVA